MDAEQTPIIHARKFALKAAALAIACAANDATACSTIKPHPTDAELFERAEEAFIARVESTKLASQSQPLFLRLRRV